MNYLDELLGLYAGRDWTTQRYFLTHLSSLPPGLESDALLEFLWGEAASPRTPLRHMARRQLGRAVIATHHVASAHVELADFSFRCR